MVSEFIKVPDTRQHAYGYHQHVTPVGYAGKRIFDLFVSLLVTILVLSWMIPLISLVVMLTSPGPPIFVQIRSGQDGRQFRCFKFRTMRTVRSDEFRQTARNDVRVTRIGGFLRRTNLDEMPQFLNVLLGDMSLVGPRPHPIQLDAQYWWKMPGYSRRNRVKPGITGLAQVSGCRGAIDHERMMQHRIRYDQFYIKKTSFFFDLYICLCTLKAMLRGNTDAF